MPCCAFCTGRLKDRGKRRLSITLIRQNFDGSGRESSGACSQNWNGVGRGGRFYRSACTANRVSKNLVNVEGFDCLFMPYRVFHHSHVQWEKAGLHRWGPVSTPNKPGWDPFAGTTSARAPWTFLLNYTSSCASDQVRRRPKRSGGKAKQQ